MSDLNNLEQLIKTGNLDLAIQLGIGIKLPVNAFVEIWFKFPERDNLEFGGIDKVQFIETWKYNQYIVSYLVEYSIVTSDDGSKFRIYNFHSIGLLILGKVIEKIDCDTAETELDLITKSSIVIKKNLSKILREIGFK